MRRHKSLITKGKILHGLYYGSPETIAGKGFAYYWHLIYENGDMCETLSLLSLNNFNYYPTKKKTI